jgi:predicted small integral membrane protein
MEHRYLKMALAVAVALQALLWFGNNVLNWETATGAVAYALSQADQAGGYERHLVPAINSPTLATFILAIVVLGEGIGGILALWGAMQLWLNRKAEPDTFIAAKRFAVLGSGIAVLVWFLLFAVLGGALLQMGQAPGLRPALDGAFKFASYSFLVLIYLSIPEPRAKEPRSATSH